MRKSQEDLWVTYVSTLIARTSMSQISKCEWKIANFFPPVVQVLQISGTTIATFKEVAEDLCRYLRGSVQRRDISHVHSSLKQDVGTAFKFL